MLKSLENKLSTFNSKRPYVWEMKITEDEFRSLEKDLCSYSPIYTKKEDALKTLVYLAEWYKRRYTNRSKKAYQATFGSQKPDLKSVWEALGIDTKYLYEGEGGQKLYLYSTFILSGLAVKFERQKNEKPFLRALCRVYNKEDESFDRIVDNNHSIAFKESIARGHSLRDFLEAIITSNDNENALPYAKEDIKNAETEIALLIDLIREINYEVNKSKFRFEWIVSSVPGDSLISRRLHIWLNPEEKGKLHQLLRIDRLKKWGFAEPENMHYVRIGVRYYNGNEVVKEPDFAHPDLYYRNTGDESIGFICEKVDYANCNNVPVVEFDRVQLITWNEDGTELPQAVQEETVDFDAMQLYRLEAGEDDWSSRVRNQKETALLFSEKWSIAESSVDKYAERKAYYNKKYGEGLVAFWCYINASVTIENENETRTFFNRQGYDHVVSRLQADTIQYTADGKVMWHHSDSEEVPETIKPISLIFDRHDIIAYHTESKEEGEEDVCTSAEIELYEYKNARGNYTPWTDIDAPKPGYVELRLTVKQKLIPYKVFYCQKPIKRVLKDNTIIYNNGIEDCVYEDKNDIEYAISRRQILDPAVSLTIGTKRDYVVVPVYRPVSLKELIYDGKVIDYPETEYIELPYILKSHITVHGYNEDGYQEYVFGKMSGLHSIIKQKRPNNQNAAWASSAAWENGDVFLANEIDVEAPNYIKVKLGERRQKEVSREDFYYWDYDADHELQKMPRRGVTAPEEWGLTFQSNKRNRTGKNYYPLINEEDDDIFDEVDHFENVSIIQCFEIALEHELYFFTFTPLKQLSEKEFESKLLNPLIEKYDHSLPLEVQQGLRRFVEEFGYKKSEEYINIINKQI